MKPSRALLSCTLCLSLLACDQQPQQTTTTVTTNGQQPLITGNISSPDVLAVVNQQPLTTSDRSLHQQQRAAEGQQVEGDELLQQLINLELLRQEAEGQGIDQRPEIAAELRRQRTALLANVLIQEIVAGFDISDEEMRTEYDRQIQQMNLSEYKARHILLEKEDEAQKVVKMLDTGADFAELAREKSTGPTATQGGDLGWFRAETMVPAFADAVRVMEVNSYSREPVKTRFGWHVILLEGTRPMAPPPFEQSRVQMRQLVINNRLNDYVDQLRSKADIDIRGPVRN
jgi:peptidyl-prolyl cis-trans isomerase C